MTIEVLRRKLVGARNLAVYSATRLTRPAADRAVAAIARPVSHAPGDGAILCEALWDHPHHWLRVAMFRAACAGQFGPGLVGVSEEGGDWRAAASMRALPLTAEEQIPLTVDQRHAETAAALLAGVTREEQLLDLALPAGYPAHHLYDGILKSGGLGELDLDAEHEALRGQLARALHYLDWYQGLFDRHPVRAVVVSHPNSIRFSTLCWVALSRSLPVFVINYTNNHITIRRLDSPADLLSSCAEYPTVADRDGLGAGQRERLAAKGREYLGLVRSGSAGQMSMVRAYRDGRPTFPSRYEFLAAAGIGTDQPVVALLGNCWPDYPNEQGRTSFPNYVAFLRATIAMVSSQTQYTWLLKPHPAEHLYGRKATLRGIVGDDLPGTVRHWPSGASGADMHAYVDCIVTAGGTAGIEYPATGRRVIAARQTPYSPWNFTRSATSAADYATLLQSACEAPLPNVRQQEDAAIFAALTLADSPDGADDLLLPFGLRSYRLWPGMPAFIRDNQVAIAREVGHIRDWVRSGHRCYAVSRALMRAAAGQTCSRSTIHNPPITEHAGSSAP